MDHHRGLLFFQDQYYKNELSMNKKGLWYNRFHVPHSRFGY